MNLRRLNNEGLRRFDEYLSQLRENPNLPPPTNLLTDSVTSQEAAPVPVSPRLFATRIEVGRWLYELIEQSRLSDPARDRGLWAWLSLLLFDQVCPPDGRGHRKPGEKARHIPEVANYQKYYRHLLASPWRMCRTHRDNPERALVVLWKPLHEPGELAEQILARQELVTNRTFMATATQLYIDATTQTAKYGASAKRNGGPRRLADFCNQIDVTWDLYALQTDTFIRKLPEEFDRFRSAA
jgi:hypothetical protein